MGGSPNPEANDTAVFKLLFGDALAAEDEARALELRARGIFAKPKAIEHTLARRRLDLKPPGALGLWALEVNLGVDDILQLAVRHAWSGRSQLS